MIAPNEFGLPVGAFVTVAIWCLLGFGVTHAVMTRRGWAFRRRRRVGPGGALGCRV